jgi:threonine dehydrogenase-like Zn-dependent dehydrogenase
MARATSVARASPTPPFKTDGRDAIIRVTACAICGSDLHIFDGLIPTMEKGDVVGHETMGEVVEVGRDENEMRTGVTFHLRKPPAGRRLPLAK